MRVSDATLAEVRERGFALMEGFLGDDELAAAQEALWLHFPRPQDYFADPPAFARYAASQFAGVEEFPYRSWDLNRLAVHPDLVDAAERYLQTAELHLYKVELWAKYAGAVNYDQPLHRDYGSHSLVVPRPEPRYTQLTTFIYLSDVTEEDGPTRIVPYEDGKDVPYTPLYLPFGSLADAEVACTGPAGSLLLYRTDILHRGSDMTGPGRSRFSILADYQVRGTTWGGKMAWPKASPERWARFIPQCGVRERDLFGFPRPGDPYWSEETLAGVGRPLPRPRPLALPGQAGVTGGRRPGSSCAASTRTSRAGEPTRVLVDRLWPRGIAKATAPFDEWLKEVAPTHGAPPLVRARPRQVRDVRRPLSAGTGHAAGQRRPWPASARWRRRTGSSWSPRPATSSIRRPRCSSTSSSGPP